MTTDEYCTDDDEDWCDMCGDERPCECDEQLKEYGNEDL